MSDRSAGAGRDGKLRELVQEWRERAASAFDSNEFMVSPGFDVERCADELEVILAADPLASDAGPGMQIVEDLLAAAELCAEMSQCEDREIRDAWKARYKRFRVYADRVLPPLASSSETQGDSNDGAKSK